MRRRREPKIKVEKKKKKLKWKALEFYCEQSTGLRFLKCKSQLRYFVFTVQIAYPLTGRARGHFDHNIHSVLLALIVPI